MKKLFYISLCLILGTVSCTDESLTPVLTFDKAGKGAYPRLVQLVTGEYDLANISASALQYEIEFVDIEQGSLVTQYDVNVAFIDNTEDNGDKGSASKTWMTFSASDFTTNADGFVGISITIPLTDVMALHGLVEADVAATDEFAFATVVTIPTGSFASTNSSATVRGGAFQGYFDFAGKLTCPLPDDLFVGEYTLSYDGPAGGGYGIPFSEGTVTLTTVEGSSTRRSMGPLTYLPGIGGFGPYDATFDFVCTFTQMEDLDSGLGCGAGSIILGNVPGSEQPVDITDDSVIRITVDEGKSTGGCGSISATATVVVLTKN